MPPVPLIRLSTKEIYLFAVIALDGDRGDVLPSQATHDLDHCLGLKVVRRYDAAEVLEPALVREFSACGGVAELWNLKANKRRGSSGIVRSSSYTYSFSRGRDSGLN